MVRIITGEVIEQLHLNVIGYYQPWLECNWMVRIITGEVIEQLHLNVIGYYQPWCACYWIARIITGAVEWVLFFLNSVHTINKIRQSMHRSWLYPITGYFYWFIMQKQLHVIEWLGSLNLNWLIFLICSWIYSTVSNKIQVSYTLEESHNLRKSLAKGFCLHFSY